MFTDFFKFELIYRLKRVSTWIFGFILFTVGFIVILASTGYFSGVSVSVGSANTEKMFLNTGYYNHIIISSIGLIMIFFTAAFMINSINRDYKEKSYYFFYTRPIKKFSYLGGRFAANILILFFYGVLAFLGMFIAAKLPGINDSYFGPFRLINYLQPLLIAHLGNILFMGSLFFAIATLTKKSFPVYIAAIVLFFGYSIGTNIMANLDSKVLAALSDPFGMVTAIVETEYWSIAEMNSKLVSLKGNILINRLIWFSVSLCLLIFSYFKYSLSYYTNKQKSKKVKETETDARSKDVEIEKYEKRFDLKQDLIQFFSNTMIEIKNMIKSPQFMIICLAGIILSFFIFKDSNKIFGTQVKLLSFIIVENISSAFRLLAVVIMTIYSGELIWKTRESKMNLMIDSTAVKDWVLYYSKILSVIAVLGAVYLVLMFFGIAYQLFNNVVDIDLMLYFKNLGINLITIYLFTGLIIFLHVFINNKYFVHFLVVGFYFFIGFSTKLGIEHNLLRFSHSSGYIYSEMNGFGNAMLSYFSYKLYWAFFTTILVIMGYLFYVRGFETELKQRIIVAKTRLSNKLKLGLLLTLLLFMVIGSYIFYNTNILDDFKTQKAVAQEKATYEKKYKKYKNLPQPKYTDVSVEVDFYPDIQAADFAGTFVLKNKHSVPIENFHITTNKSLVFQKLEISKPNELEAEDDLFSYKIYRFKQPLSPGEEFTMRLECSFRRTNFDKTTRIVENGSFITNNFFMPLIGYQERKELVKEKNRERYGLKPKERMAAVNDPVARQYNYLTDDADWVDFKAVVSTAKDQIAITPGYLKKEWTEDDRRYFAYEMDQPILNFFSFVSARYEVTGDKWVSSQGKIVDLKVYHHPTHDYNVDRMLLSLKKSLTYFSKNYGEYPHRQVRILEFPRYSSYAQSFPNTIPFSEAVGFIADIDDKKQDIDYPFEITAHELAHQWWAHQVVGANVKGAVLMSEALAQYSSEMVLEDEYGKELLKKYLKHEKNTYLRGRGNESIKEQPLRLVENQPYIHYNKGSIVMYSLQRYIGEGKLNNALKSYCEDVRWQEPLYTNSDEFLSYIRAATPDSLQYLITDMFEKITFYENKVIKAKTASSSGDKHVIDLVLRVEKKYSNGQGKEESVESRDLIEIGLYSKDDKEIYLKKHWLNTGDNKITVTLNKKPEKVIIDPNNLLIDRITEDNSMEIN